MASSIVIKVKHGETRRRFNATVDETGKLDLDMARLREKIVSLFNFLLDADLALAYTDEDGDLIPLANEEDLRNVMKQSLTPLEITVKLSGRYNPITTPGTFLNLPRFLYLAISFLPLGLARTALAARIAEIVKCFAKRRGTFMNPLPKLRAYPKMTSLSGTSGSETQKNDVIAPPEIFTTGPEVMNRETYDKSYNEIVRRKFYPWTFKNKKSRASILPDKFRDAITNSSGEYEHWDGYTCSRCGVHIVSGRQFKISDDLVCKMCFSVEGTKIKDQPVMKLPTALPFLPFLSVDRVINSSFEGDFGSVLNGAVLAPSTKFTKIWRMRNNGDGRWPKGTDFRMVEGNYMGNTSIISLQIPKDGLLVGRDVDIYVNFTSPSFPGQYVSFWYLTVSGVPFGQPAVVFIQVASPSVGSSTVSSASSNTPELGSGKNDGNISENIFVIDHDIFEKFVKISPSISLDQESRKRQDLNELIAITKISPSRSPDQESKKRQDLNELKPSTEISPSGFPDQESTKSQDLNEMKPDAIPTAESEDPGDFQCAHCWIQIVSGSPFQISEEEVCKRCFQVESRMIRDRACAPSRLNPIRMRRINSTMTGDYGTITDGAVLAPSTPFKKIWRIRNSGTDSWPKGTRFMMVEGDALSDRKGVSLQIPENGLHVGSEIEIPIHFIAPQIPGQYVSFWQLKSFGMPINQPLVVFIQVAAAPMNKKPINSPVLNVSPVVEIESPNHGGNYSNGHAGPTPKTRNVETGKQGA